LVISPQTLQYERTKRFISPPTDYLELHFSCLFPIILSPIDSFRKIYANFLAQFMHIAKNLMATCGAMETGYNPFMGIHKKDPLLEALAQGQSYTWTVPDGGDLASMREAIQHGQTLILAPVGDPAEIQTGDLVLVKWHQGDIFHLVGEIEGERFLIVNSLGKVNGWVGVDDILGRVTQIVEPEPRPSVEGMLAQLEAAIG
jgi:hypothetical protein